MAAASPVGVYTGAGMAAYGFHRGSLPDGSHYFGPGRFPAFARAFAASGLQARARQLDAPAADDADLTLFHAPDYLADVRARSAAGLGALDHGPTPAEPHMPAAAACVVGAVLDAARRICEGDLRRAFVPISGFHHARRDAAANYCIFNDCALVLALLHRLLPGRTIAYVDIDVHFGDGVWDAFADHPRTVIVDVHQDSRTFWYSGGREVERGDTRTARTWSVALRPGAGDVGLAAAWSAILPWLAAHAPAFVVLNAGADGLAGDRLGGLLYTSASFTRVTADLVALADRHAEGRVLVLGGGGYHDGLAAAWLAVVAALLGESSCSRP
jgi:acetoin utilization protein AcuC